MSKRQDEWVELAKQRSYAQNNPAVRARLDQLAAAHRDTPNNGGGGGSGGGNGGGGNSYSFIAMLSTLYVCVMRTRRTTDSA